MSFMSHEITQQSEGLCTVIYGLGHSGHSSTGAKIIGIPEQNPAPDTAQKDQDSKPQNDK